MGIGATILNNARIGEGSIIAAGAVIPEQTVIPPNSLVAGVPGKVRRTLGRCGSGVDPEVRAELSGLYRDLPERELPADRGSDRSDSIRFATLRGNGNFESSTRHAGPAASGDRALEPCRGTARAVFARYGFGEIRTPIFEDTALFARGVGEETDIVSKEMYTWEDRARAR